MGKWARIQEADPTGQRNPYFGVGSYIVQIEACREQESFDGNLYFIIEAKILSTDNETLKPGTVCAQVIKFNSKAGPVNVARFLLAAAGRDCLRDVG
jgi:hypothetical protein